MLIKSVMKQVILLFCAAILLSCTTKKQEETALHLGVMPSMDYLPLAVAAREGYFDEAGLKLKLHKFYSANERDAAFQSGGVDGAVIDYTGAVLQKAGGIHLKLVSQCDAPFYIIAGGKTGIVSVKGLKGKTVAVSQNTVIDYCVDMALAAAGLRTDDIKRVEINKIPLRFEMLQSHKIDATALPDPLATKAGSLGDTVLTTNSELGFSVTGIMFSENALHTKKEQIAKMYKAYNRGVDYLRHNPVSAIEDILIHEMGFTEDTVPLAVLPDYVHAAPPADEDIASVVSWLAKRNLVPRSFDRASLIERGILENE